MVQLAHPYMTTGKTVALTRQILLARVVSLLFNMLSRFIIVFLAKSMSFNFMSAFIIHRDFRSQEIKICNCFTLSASISHGLMGLDAMIFVFWMLKNSPLSSSSRGSLIPLYFAFRVVSSAYLRLLIFFLAILIPPYDSSSPSFCMSFSPYEFNKHRDNIQLYHTPLPTLNQSFVLCLLLTVASWSSYRFLRRQVRFSGIPTSFRIFHSWLWST